MRYTYAYKTPDGVRHEAAMEASSREEVFAALRQRGIRPIKVVAADGSKANGEIRGVRKRAAAAAAVAAALLAGGGVYFLAPDRERGATEPEGPPEIAFTSDEYRAAFTNLEARSLQAVARHVAALEALNLDQLADYQFVENAKDAAAMAAKVRQGYRTVDDARMEVRELFKPIFAIFPAECAAERNAAQQLYAEAMELLEASERRIVKDEKALRLLVENRGKWHWQGGRVVWSDAALANEFEYFRREASPVQKRRAAVIESPIVRIPANR